MLKEIWKFYKSYEWKKCSYSTYTKRVYAWNSFEEAIIKWHITKIKNWINCDKKKCKKCWCMKYFSDFYKSKEWYVSKCKVCMREVLKEYHKRNRDKIIKKKKERRQTELWKIKTKLDKIFYSDKNIKKIIQIEWKQKRIKQARKWEIQKDKFFYFISRGYEREFLIKIYWNFYLNNEL